MSDRSGEGGEAEAPLQGGAPDGPPPPELRFLKALVVALTTVMIGGIVAIVVLLALRLPGGGPAPEAPLPAPPVPLPDSLVLPEGVAAEAVAFGPDWLVVLTPEGEALVYDRASGALRDRIRLLPEQ